MRLTLFSAAGPQVQQARQTERLRLHPHGPSIHLVFVDVNASGDV